jgi:hypothetical protein
MFISFVLWISSVWYAVTMGMKHGLTFEVTTRIGDIERTMTQNTMFNVFMSGAFSWMLLTAFLSAGFLFGLNKANGGVESIE